MRKHLQRLRTAGTCCVLLAAGTIAVSPVAAANGCAPGFLTNPYNGQCFSPQQAPTINGVTCTPGNLGCACRSSRTSNRRAGRPVRSVSCGSPSW